MEADFSHVMDFVARQLPSLNGLRVFEAVSRHMSFTAAGDELCVTQGAVSRSIKGLEQELGVSLFLRMPRRLALTEEGRSLSLNIQEAFDLLERAALRVSNRGGTRILTINVLPTFASKWLMPRLVDFNDRCPNKEVRLIASIRPVDFSSEDVDVAIRVGRIDVAAQEENAPRIDLVMTNSLRGIRAVRLLPDELVPVASPALLKECGNIRDVKDFDRFTLLHNTTRKNAWPDWLSAVDASQVSGRKNLFFGHFFLAMDAAIKGQGIGLIPRILAEDDIHANRLIAVYDRSIASAGDYFLLCRQHHWDTPKIRSFREWLLRMCAQT